MPDDDRVDAHGLKGLRGVLEGLALRDAGALGREVDHVGGEALLGGLEGDPGPGGVLEEQVADGPAAQGRQLLDGPVGHPGHLLGGVEDQDGVVAGEVGGRDEVTHHRGFSPWWGGARACGGAGVCPCPAGKPVRLGGGLGTEQDGVATVFLGELDLDRLPQRRGEVLADVVGADRKFAVAAVDEDRELDGARAADVAEGVEGGADGAAGEEHVVDEDDEAAVDAVAGDVGAAEGAGRLSAAGRPGTS